MLNGKAHIKAIVYISIEKTLFIYDIQLEK